MPVPSLQYSQLFLSLGSKSFIIRFLGAQLRMMKSLNKSQNRHLPVEDKYQTANLISAYYCITGTYTKRLPMPLQMYCWLTDGNSQQVSSSLDSERNGSDQFQSF